MEDTKVQILNLAYVKKIDTCERCNEKAAVKTKHENYVLCIECLEKELHKTLTPIYPIYMLAQDRRKLPR